MKSRLQKHIPVIAVLILGIVSAFCLMIYARPMQDVSLDLTPGFREDLLELDPADYDSKGWTVYTQEGETVTALTSDGIGGYMGLELGQTFYYSRVMSEELDSPTLQIGVGESTVSIWLDGVLIYTDFPEQENRIGYLHLPMNEWYRDPITVSLPMDYQGKTLVIAQSSPEWAETSAVKVWPAETRIYCGYAYESSLISESFRTATVAGAAFLLVNVLPLWVLFAAVITAVVLGAVYWWKESWFYRVFTPAVLTCVPAYWLIVIFRETGTIWEQITASLGSGQIHYFYHCTMPAVTAAALFAAVAEFIHTELNRRAEQQLLEERREMAQVTYESMCRQHEEVMKLRHDMAGHLETLRGMSGSAETTAYIDNLIGKNKRVRPIVHTGNEVLDIILNSKLSAAMDAGIHVEIVRSTAPEKLPIPDNDLSSIVINILNNALKAAKASNAEKPFLKLDVHIKGSWLAIVCENSADIRQIEKKVKKETVPKHGLGLKIIEETAKQHNGLFDTEYGQVYYKVSVVLPLN